MLSQVVEQVSSVLYPALEGPRPVEYPRQLTVHACLHCADPYLVSQLSQLLVQKYQLVVVNVPEIAREWARVDRDNKEANAKKKGKDPEECRLTEQEKELLLRWRAMEES